MSDALEPALTLDTASPMQQLRFLPLALSGQRGFLAIHSDCPSIDPWPPYFTLPTDTLKLTAFSENGEKIWHRDLGPGVVPGVWFCPVYAFDLDDDGIDEIFLVNRSEPDHPLDMGSCVLEQVSASSGELISSLPWPKVRGTQPLSHLWRNFVNGGFSHGRKRLITAQGTYGPMQIQCWDPNFRELWSRKIEPEESGPMGSHMFCVLDIDGDGRDELFWGERLIDIDTGKDIWIADSEEWRGHSDIVQPFLDLKSGRWSVYTCRETAAPPEARGVVTFDDCGKELWGLRGLGHMHAGWAGRLCEDGSHLFYAFDCDSQKHYCFDRDGIQVDPGMVLNRSVPVDFDGDGLHELVYTAKEDRGNVVTRKGELMATLRGKPARFGKIMDLPGEQIVTWPKYERDGRIRIYALPTANDSAASIRRYEHPFYNSSLRLWAVGYNWRNLGGL